MIKLTDILKQSVIKLTEGGKLFGSRAQRVTTADMNAIFDELKKRLGSRFEKFQLSKALPSKADHGDIDIVITGNPDVKQALFTYLGPLIKDYSKNGDIYSVLYSSEAGKTVHVDFLYASADDYDAQYDYLSYNDFSGILGVFARRLRFKYGTDGFFKIYEDKRGQYHYILLTKNLRDGLKMLGYAPILSKFDDIKTLDDIVEFISYTDLFDSTYFEGVGHTNSDRKRMRAGRPSAQEIKAKLIALNKRRTQPDAEHYVKTLFPDKYADLVKKQAEIEAFAPMKGKYGGDWILQNFPQIKPGPALGKIKLFWTQKYGDKLDDVSDDELRNVTAEFLKTLK